ncbi:TetR family transcriptional regulator C-terminal domain-containing protein [Gulosibacter molinativorax]|nr:TetR family transcriptional regulator C-terminal domain-containing protein [Gulosibacter molinativorax]QUY63269.1 Hypotetical protein [Gulosibacter molinativorax]
MTKGGTKRGRPPIDPDDLVPILEAVLRLATTKNSQLITVREIAQEADVSVGRLQHHFGTRDELIGTAFEHHLLKVTDRLQNLRDAPGSARERMSRMIDEIAFNRAWRRSTIWIDLIAHAVSSDRYRAAVERINDAWNRVFTELIADGEAVGEFRLSATAEMTAAHLVAVSDGLTVMVITDGEGQAESRGQARRDMLAAAVSAALGGEFPTSHLPRDDRTPFV